jgi:prolyl 4-hydroxylase
MATMLYDLISSGADQTATRLASIPGARKVPNRHLSQFAIPHFFDADTCIALMSAIDDRVRPSTITDDNGDPEFRTSQTGDLDYTLPLTQKVDAMICAALGIAKPFSEPMQVQRYDVGQQFKGHTDYFEPTGMDYEEHTHIAGQRTWTAMAYLNDVPAGGATRFSQIDKIHQPEQGKLLIWNNLTDDGQCNPWTLHHAMKVRKGRKYVVTKWFRERHWPWG